MASTEEKARIHDIPTSVFEEFIAVLEKSDVSTEVIAALRKTILEDKTFTEAALRSGLGLEEKGI